MKKYSYLFFLCVLFFQCEEKAPIDFPEAEEPLSDWLIPEQSIFSGGPGRDGIPSVDAPKFVSTADADAFLEDEDLVVGVISDGEIKVYPHIILDWHEIVNDSVGNSPIAMVYCPLTGTATCWSRKLINGVTTFGVSGLLYNTNIIPFDRKSNSDWSQLRLKAVRGNYQGEGAKTLVSVETTWATWKTWYPTESQVMSIDTGFDRPYELYPYEDYKTQDARLLFPVVPVDQRLPLKERVLSVVVNQKAKVYRFDSFKEQTKVINDQFSDKLIVASGNKNNNWMVAYNRTLSDGTILDFTLIENALPLLMRDQEGNEWDVFGVAQSGPRKGTRLEGFPSIMGYWLAFGSFYATPEIYK